MLENDYISLLNMKRIIKGYNDLRTLFPTIAEQWDAFKNGQFIPDDFLPGSAKKVWWVCPKGHSWQAKIHHRTEGHGCPYCSGLLPIEGQNDLATICEKAIEYWDYEKNGSLKPNMFLPNSEKKVWWICSNGHSWEKMIASFYKHPVCPYCSGKKLLFGINDLETCFPSIAKEWNYEKNILQPRNYFKCSNMCVWWKCSNGHEWKSRISARTTQNLGCPYCSHKKGCKDYNFIKTNAKLLNEWDFGKNGDLNPFNLTPHSNVKVWWKCKYNHSWMATINHRMNGNNCPVCKKNLQTSFPEQALFFYIKKFFDDARNNDKENGFEFDIYIPSIRTAIEYDGVAFHNNERKRTIDNNKNIFCLNHEITLIRVLEKGLSNFNNCICFFRKDTTSFNSLNEIIITLLKYLKLNYKNVDVKKDFDKIYSFYSFNKEEKSIVSMAPNLVDEWNYSKNGSVNPNMFSAGSAQIVWWKCKNGHEWQARIYSRVKGHGCPICGRTITIECKKKKVICIETNEVYESITIAEQKTGVNKNSIIRCCKFKANTAGGYHWKYAESYKKNDD